VTDQLKSRAKKRLAESAKHEVEPLRRRHSHERETSSDQAFAARIEAIARPETEKKGVMLTEHPEFFSAQLLDIPSSSLSAPALHSEFDLLRRLKAHDEDAFETMVRRYGARMFATARKLLGNEHDARDAVQQALTSAFRAIAGFNADATLSTWLHRIVVNAALMQLRSRRRRPELPIEDLLPRFDDAGRWVDESDQTGWGDMHPVHRRETRQMVRRCIDQLPESYRAVLLLREIEDLDIGEVAAMLAVSPNAIKIRVHRARHALRNLIERERSVA
jgi:RNA polymerase sigma-70 factor (ECF subfamily)